MNEFTGFKEVLDSKLKGIGLDAFDLAIFRNSIGTVSISLEKRIEKDFSDPEAVLIIQDIVNDVLNSTSVQELVLAKQEEIDEWEYYVNSLKTKALNQLLGIDNNGLDV